MSEELVLRGYNPATDFSDLEHNLKQAGLHDPDRDNERRLAQYANDVIVAEIGGRVVGSIYVVDHIVPTIWRLNVEESHQGQGIGTELLKVARDRLRDAGATDFEGFFGAEDEELLWWYRNRGMRTGDGLYRSTWAYTRDQFS